ncbi:unnamed protein product [Paramecium primaurelia]|uniref:Uncharacterized protein n=1 Tax=Paramecium primaurelia TaxID=5886 RepID=A0A8S1MM98_PARPR|nr:unnamed protein product [Paramecium primaurelia]
MQYDQDIGPWYNDEIRPRSRCNNQHTTSLNKNISDIKDVHHLTHQINSERRNELPRLKLNNITPRVLTKRLQNNESVKKREDWSEQHAFPQFIQRKALLQLKRPKHRHTEIQVVQEIEKIIRRNLFYIPTHKYSILD